MDKNHFLRGILFISVLYPLICEIVALLTQIIECGCAKFAVKTAEMQSEITDRQTPTNTCAVGFQYDGPEEEEEYL